MVNIRPYGESSILSYYGGYLLRKIFSTAPYFKLIPEAGSLGRNRGISAMVRIRNEPWIEPSLESIKDFADEIIVIDSSTDLTPERVAKSEMEHGLRIKYIRKKCDLLEASKIAFIESSYEWIIKWDGDFIGYPRRLERLRKKLMELSSKKYYLIEFPLLCLDLDFFHVRKDISPYQIEGWLYKYSPQISYVIDPKFGFEKPLIPRFYEKLYFETVFGLHLRSVKSNERLIERKFETAWMRERNKENFGNSFEEYLRFNLKKNYDSENFKQIAPVKLLNLSNKLESYKKEKFGDYPTAIKNYVEKEYNIKL